MRQYRILESVGFVHQTAFQKYSFIDSVSLVHTKNVEEINNII
jgi:hypothetical protein